MKIVIIGADGQLGCDLCRVILKEEQIPLTLKDIDNNARAKRPAYLAPKHLN